MRRSSLKPLLLILALSLLLSACGGDDEETTAGGGTSTTQGTAGNGVDLAFAKMMIPHHQSAIDMAKLAQDKGESMFVQNLADDIIAAQQEEIEVLTQGVKDLEAAGVEEGDLGLAEHETGMDADLDELRDANPFDRAFIDMMVPHHRGAIAMAEVEVKKGKEPSLLAVAENILTTQQVEIDAMNEHRKENFGGEVPEEEAGGHSG